MLSSSLLIFSSTHFVIKLRFTILFFCLVICGNSRSMMVRKLWIETPSRTSMLGRIDHWLLRQENIPHQTCAYYDSWNNIPHLTTAECWYTWKRAFSLVSPHWDVRKGVHPPLRREAHTMAQLYVLSLSLILFSPLIIRTSKKHEDLITIG